MASGQNCSNSKQRIIRVASSETPNDFKEVTISNANSSFFDELGKLRSEFDGIGIISESSLNKFRDSSPLARNRLRELKGMKRTFLKELEAEAKKGNEMVAGSLKFYEALLDADRLRQENGKKRKPGNSKKN